VENIKVNDSYSHEILLVDSVSFPIDSITPLRGNLHYYAKRKDVPEVLVYLNQEFNQLQFYDFISKQQFCTISYDKEGINGIGKVWGYYFHNWDSIFIIDSYKYKMYLTDSSAKIKNKYSLLNPKVKMPSKGFPVTTKDAYSCLPFHKQPTKMVGSKLLIYCIPSVIEYEDYIKAGKYILEIDIHTGEIIFSGHSFPKYLEKTYPSSLLRPDFAYNNRNDRFISSFQMDDSVLPSFLCNQIQSRVYVFLKACRALILYTAVWS